ncbi:MAG: nucleoside deaminase, partial [Victivallales bacterium]|nr:nucleoside deaminase [Victivallales bacterium]
MMSADEDEKFMRIALEEAAVAAAEGEVPVGAVMVRDGAVVAREHNRVEAAKRGSAHAEML